MASAIGLRVYQITIHKKRKVEPLAFDSAELSVSTFDVLSDFFSINKKAVQNDERERSWYIEQRIVSGPGNSKGYVHYGTYGFESNLIDTKTQKQNYRRKVDDVEEIPLFYEFWHPNAQYALAAFQSFQGRSCIALVMEALKKFFEEKNPGYILSLKKLMPNDAMGSLYGGAPVKKLRLIKRDPSPDIVDRYLGGVEKDDITFEVSLSASRKKSLGDFASISKSLKSKADGVVSHEGVEFNQAIAEIKIGGKLRRVGVFGVSGDAGVIDITEDIKRGGDGHPTFESLEAQSNLILQDLCAVISRGK